MIEETLSSTNKYNRGKRMVSTNWLGTWFHLLETKILYSAAIMSVA